MRNLVSTIVLAAGLFGDVSSAQVGSMRDSAGVRIVEVADSVLETLPRWSLDGPLLQIGDAGGDRLYELNEATAPWRLADGRIVVDHDRVELRFYDAQGRHLASVGRRGHGPGEYQHLHQLWRAPHDSLLVGDALAGRVDVRGPAGEFVRSIHTPRSLAPAWLPDRTAILWYSTKPDLTTAGLQRGAIIFRRMLADGRAVDTLAILPGGSVEVLAGGAWRGVRLAGVPIVASGPGGAVYVDGEQLAVHWFGPEGRLLAITRVGVPRVRVTAAHRRTDARAMASEVQRTRRLGVEPGARPARYAEYLPQATWLRLDADGRAWVRRWTAWGSAHAEWIVFAARGLPVARVQMPARFDPNDIGLDYVLGLAVDDDGVQSVVHYRIRR